MRRWIAVALLVWTAVAVPCLAWAQASRAWKSAFASAPDRVWVGPDFWANPLQDWRVADSALECVTAGPGRSLALLTRDLSQRVAGFSMDLTLAQPVFAPGAPPAAWIGFRAAARGRFNDYRDDAVFGKGIEAGVAADGRLFVGETSLGRVADPASVRRLRLALARAGLEWRLQLTALGQTGRVLAVTGLAVSNPENLRGGLALVCHDTPCRVGAWTASGAKLDAHPGRAFGPILFTQYTVSRGVLTLTAQMTPVGEEARREAVLQRRDGARWIEAGRAALDPLARTATFRVTRWDASRDHAYRVSLSLPDRRARLQAWSFEGTIRRDPAFKPAVVVAAFTGNNDLGFPHADIVKHVSAHRPDLLVFTGDQIYEPVGGFGVQRAPLEAATLDYLRKWFIFGWEYRDLLKDIPSVALPDDHDVYHGNLWGAGGRDAGDIVEALRREGVSAQMQKQDSGGFTMPVPWVTTFLRTKTRHLPARVDPAPADRGIGVYFTELVWGGVSFAILEDRKWKSPPAVLLPEAQIVNGWARNPAWNSAVSSDVPGADLLGPRQMVFLERWAGAQASDVWMKAVVSQTIFANVATLPRSARADDVTPKLSIQPPGGYAPGEAPVQDHDSNGWPQSPRLAVLRLMQRAKAVHIAGDQHLGSTIQYGIDAFRDGPYAICVPSVANYFPRRWFPEQEGANRAPGAPRNTGDYLDGFGNRITVLAVSNPFAYGIEPVDINDRAPGYGIITFERATGRITMANWPRWVDPAAPGAAPYPGWPITFHRNDNGGGSGR